jgi:hypothetical protein
MLENFSIPMNDQFDFPYSISHSRASIKKKLENISGNLSEKIKFNISLSFMTDMQNKHLLNDALELT